MDHLDMNSPFNPRFSVSVYCPDLAHLAQLSQEILGGHEAPPRDVWSGARQVEAQGYDRDGMGMGSLYDLMWVANVGQFVSTQNQRI